MHLNKIFKKSYFTIILFLIICCANNNDIEIIDEEVFEDTNADVLKILSLGDSYTIGQSVCENCKFPSQLVDSLKKRNNLLEIELNVIATTGWTTSNLINAINNQDLDDNYNFATLLIGVNNQYQNIPFSVYEKEFPDLIQIATTAVGGNKEKLVVLSIPDYAFTPFGNANTTISEEIKKYNDFAKTYCENKNITFLNITDITQEGLTNTSYVANDGLHPSEEAYSLFIERLLPIAIQKLNLQ